MKLRFLGAARSVTGSCFLLETDNSVKLLVDCGMLQGKDQEREGGNERFLFNPAEIDAVLLTHAHIDHAGRIPLLIKRGFSGRIYCTRATAQLCSIMLPDSGHIQEQDAQWRTRKQMRSTNQAAIPLYTAQDAIDSLRYFSAVDYGDVVEVVDGVRARFSDAGHLLGSSCIELWCGDEKFIF